MEVTDDDEVGWGVGTVQCVHAVKVVGGKFKCNPDAIQK